MASPFGLSLPNLSQQPVLWPLISTTASFSIAIWEFITFIGLVRTSRIDKSAAARTISLWWKLSLHSALPVILGLGLSSLGGGIAAVRRLRGRERNVAIAGTALCLGHFLYGPAIAQVIRGMANAYDGLDGIEAKEEQRGEVVDDCVVEGQMEWLRIHAWRTLTSDGPAMACFVWLAARETR